MTDFEFERNREFAQSFDSLPAQVKCPEFTEIAETFRTNMRRVRSLGAMPIELIYWTMAFTAHRKDAERLLGLPATTPETPELAATANQLLREWIQKRDALGPAAALDHTWSLGGQNLKATLAADASGELARGIEAVLSAMITGAWAAFETLAIDLWIEALNKHPVPLATKFSKLSKDKSITLAALAQHNFDIAGKVGQILHDTRKVNLETFDSLKLAYHSAFGDKATAVFTKYKRLFIAERARHLLAHRSGNVDKKFAREMKSVKELGKLVPGKMLPLTGHWVAGNVDVCIRAGVELLNFVDEWSANYGEAKKRVAGPN